MSHAPGTPDPSPTRAIATTAPDAPDAAYPGSTPPPGTAAPTGGGAARHIISLAIGLVLPAFAFVAFDWGFARYSFDRLNFRSFGDGDLLPYLIIAGAAALLLVVAAAGRLSPVGPAVAGVLYGVVPTAVVVLAADEIFRAGSEVRGWAYSQALINVPVYGVLLYPTIAALLIGTAIAATGRRRERG